VTATVVERPASKAERAPDWRGRLRRGALYALLVFVLLSLVRQITGATDLTSAGTLSAALGLSVPIGMAALGGLFSERAGVVNIGLEGMMIFGTWFTGWAGYQWGPWLGVVFGVLGGALFGLVHAVATVTFGVDHVISGVAINIIALGATRYLSSQLFVGKPGGGVNQSPRVDDVKKVSVPWLSSGYDALGRVEHHRWFLVSDLAGLVRGLTGQLSLLTLIALALLPLSYLLLWRTNLGLRIRSVGENPYAAESLGVPVYSVKYLAVTLSGALAGLGGAFLVVVYGGNYVENQTGGRGYIGLAAMIFGNWHPAGLAAGSGLFGFFDALRLRQGTLAVHALLLFVTIVMGLLLLRAAWKRQWVQAAGFVVIGGLAAWWYFATDSVPTVLVPLVPYVATLLVLAMSAKRLRPPAADGLPFRRGGGG
jgi:general nucleoside transport system permease protein